jgi:large subunit ribosomal protein L18
MNQQVKNNILRLKRKNRTRAKIFGTSDRPRLSVFRSNKYTYAQLIDDEHGKTLLSLSSQKLKETSKKSPVELSKILGEKLGGSAIISGFKRAIFDKGSYKYHGRVKALVEGVRSAGLKI